MVQSKRAKLMRPIREGDTVKWESTAGLWVSIERQEKSNLFSRNGLGAQSVKITLNPHKGITLHNAVEYGGVHYFLTGIDRDGPAKMMLRAAVVRIEQCELERPTTGKDELKRPVQAEPERLHFPAAVTEKYIGYTQELPQAVTQTVLVLVTSKLVELRAGDLVHVGVEPYVVQVCHTQDEYKNEYEVSQTKDV